MSTFEAAQPNPGLQLVEAGQTYDQENLEAAKGPDSVHQVEGFLDGGSESAPFERMVSQEADESADEQIGRIRQLGSKVVEFAQGVGETLRTPDLTPRVKGLAVLATAAVIFGGASLSQQAEGATKKITPVKIKQTIGQALVKERKDDGWKFTKDYSALRPYSASITKKGDVATVVGKKYGNVTPFKIIDLATKGKFTVYRWLNPGVWRYSGLGDKTTYADTLGKIGDRVIEASGRQTTLFGEPIKTVTKKNSRGWSEAKTVFESALTPSKVVTVTQNIKGNVVSVKTTKK